MRLHPALEYGTRDVLPFRGATLSTRIVHEVREALFAKDLRPGDFLGTEKDLAQRFNVSRIVAPATLCERWRPRVLSRSRSVREAERV
jgi:Bacterial regulatory proteins, gntR family